jgi:hypothetical protein
LQQNKLAEYPDSITLMQDSDDLQQENSAALW